LLCHWRRSRLRSERTALVWIMLEVGHAIGFHEPPQVLSETVLGLAELKICLNSDLHFRVSENTKSVNIIVT